MDALSNRFGDRSSDGFRRLGRVHNSLCLGLAAQRSVQRVHGSTDGLRIAARIGGFQRFCGIQHDAVAGAERSVGLFTIGGFAVKRLVNRLAKGVPQLLFKTAIQRHRVGFGLPALLQGLDRVNSQLGGRAQHIGLIDHGVTLFNAELLQRLQWRCRRANGSQPQRLHLGSGFFAHVTRFPPAVAKLVQDAVEAFPVIVQRCGVGRAPSFDFFNQRQTPCLVLGRVGLHFLQPGLHHLEGLVAGFIKALPQAMVGHAALVGLLPLLAQRAQVFLHLATAQLMAWLAFEQAFGFGHEFFTQLVGPPALPPFEFTGGSQRRIGLVFELVVNHPAKFLERVAQGVGGTRAGFAVAFSNFKLQL